MTPVPPQELSLSKEIESSDFNDCNRVEAFGELSRNLFDAGATRMSAATRTL
jgi:hypothetical protein